VVPHNAALSGAALPRPTAAPCYVASEHCPSIPARQYKADP
jgi:hypothetical protein